MKLEDARWVLREVDGRPYSWLKSWGLSTISEAVRTVRERKSSTKADLLIADRIKNKILRKW